MAYVTIDAVIDLAWTRQMHADKPDDFFTTPTPSLDVWIQPFGECG